MEMDPRIDPNLSQPKLFSTKISCTSNQEVPKTRWVLRVKLIITKL